MTLTEVGAVELAALLEAVAEVFTDACPPDALRDGATASARVWRALNEMGVTRLGIPEEQGGDGGGLVVACELVKLAGRYAASGLLPETSLLGGWLLAAAGLPQPDGPVTTGTSSLVATRDRGTWRLRGAVERVPTGPEASVVALAVEADDRELLVEVTDMAAEERPGRNLAREPRCTYVLDAVIPRVVSLPAGTGRELRLRGALSRALLIAGALERVQQLTVGYAGERVQFGRPLAAFQAIQQQVARLAGEVAAANAATDAAVRSAADRGFLHPHTDLLIAAAKVRSAQAASEASAIAHQVHAAIGMTEEHPLHLWTTRLWSWRSEWGSEATWSEYLADLALPGRSTGLWPLMTGVGDE